ncbi:MAG: hypothetical protein H0W20_10800 [Chthoniobacterales bacterium]|nr:hypothetical protein [Chthoniobacterales bacterium]
MKFCAGIITLLLFTAVTAHPIGKPQQPDPYRQLSEVTPLPMALDPAFEFRKTKLTFLGDVPGPRRGRGLTGGVVRDPSLGFEASYRFHGAVTALDFRQRLGHYFDFFWRAKRPANITVRLEYRQQNLRAETQAREVSYQNVKGSYRTEFGIIGDDFHTDGRVTAWRCLLIENGRIVAEDKSFLWK